MRRPLVLNGFMATGKSSIGRRVAARTSRPFLDLDSLIEAQAGVPVQQIFRERGEAAFRALERGALLRVLEDTAAEAPVVAVGGGALLSRELRLQALDRAVVISLQASVGEILRRAAADAPRPNLAGPDPLARASELLELREPAYAEAHARLPTEGRDLEDLSCQAEQIWRRDPLAVAAGGGSYSIEVGHDLLREISTRLAPASRWVLVSDSNVFALHGARALGALGAQAEPVIVQLTPGEEHKQIQSVERIWRAALEAGADRSSCFVALGGGVVTDITGFAAATYMRGVRWFGVPTTLLAMVDASVGGKTGVDLLAAKNAVGAFHQPSGVLCDVDLLSTESARGFRGALAEVVKTAIIGDAPLLELLERQSAQLAERSPALVAELVRRSIRVKARVVSQDEREGGLRAILNLGHTVGHALEAQAGYTRLSHGEAVSLGLVAALRIGVVLGVTPQALAERIEALLERLGLPTDLGAESLEEAVALIGHDKKRAGKRLRFVVARAPEQVEILDVELERIQRAVLALK